MSSPTIPSAELNVEIPADLPVTQSEDKLSLDALLSPHPAKETLDFQPDETPPPTATEPAFNEVSLDDDRFSTVPLTARQSRHSDESPPETTTEPVIEEETTVDHSHFSTVPLTARHSRTSVASNEIQSEEPISIPINAERGRKEVVSIAASDSSTLALHRRSTSRDRPESITGNTPFILARLESQKEQDEVGTPGKRFSMDGQLKLQEEFMRVQHDIKEEDEIQAAALASTIDWDFWGAVISDYQGFAVENPEKLARAIERGIPSTLRGMMWQLMSAAKDPELEATYLNLLKESSPHEKSITRDLGRTFPHNEYFSDGAGIGQENLFNVLKAYSIYDPEVGYCQGMPFIVAILLLNMPDEEAFSLLVRLMYSYDVRGHFLPEMPKLLLRLYQFERLLEELMPVLHIHFLRQGVKSSMFCSQWFLTLFSYRFPLDIAFRIYDNCLASGIEAIFGFSIVLLQKNEEELLKLKFDEILAFMNTRVFDNYKIERPEEDRVEGQKKLYRVDEFVQDAVSLKITPFMLDSYAHEYEDIIRRREAHAAELDALRNSNRNLLAQVKTLEDSLASLNEEHVEVLNELVKTRLGNQETESELVRYKLLYAEAMHKNDEARSSQSRTSATSLMSQGASLFSRRS